MNFNCPYCGKNIGGNISFQITGQCACEGCGEIIDLTLVDKSNIQNEVEEIGAINMNTVNRHTVLNILEEIRTHTNSLPSKISDEDNIKERFNLESRFYDKFRKLIHDAEIKSEHLKKVENQDGDFLITVDTCLNNYKIELEPAPSLLRLLKSAVLLEKIGSDINYSILNDQYNQRIKIFQNSEKYLQRARTEINLKGYNSAAPQDTLNEWSSKENYNSNKSGCFIATATYGTANDYRVKELRYFRDNLLLKNSFGKDVIYLYYKVSPSVAKLVEKSSSIRQVIKCILYPVNVFIKRVNRHL
jgi:hypothetical protein